LLDFDPNRSSIAPRDSATVVVVRESAVGLEVFCVRRHAKSGFLGGAVVFPGGKLDPDDALPDWDALGGPLHPRAALLAEAVVEAASDAAAASPRALAVAAARELLEEAGILPAIGDAGALPMEPEIAALRATLAGGFAAALRAQGLRLRLDALVPFARWVTPEAESRRFDARFFLLRLPEGQQGSHDAHEVTNSFWATPAQVLADFERGAVMLVPPTTRTLELLAGVRSWEAAVALAEAQSLLPVVPRFVMSAEGAMLALPGDPDHEVREQRVAGPTRFVLRDGRFVSADPPRPAA
jgi:8-oxo-dGTP pyrophosphatase MutT (NUDIX family)